MRILITGGCGFIGSNFINYYFEKNKPLIDKLINIDAMYYCADEMNIKREIRQDGCYVCIKGNICDADLLHSILHKYDITHVVHFAAQSHVPNSFSNPMQFTYDNVVGTHTLLEMCRQYGKIKRFIHVSTDEVYGESINNSCKTEESLLVPTNPYAATKASADLIAQSYIRSYNMPIIITRGNNVYGPNQYPEKLIPLFIKLLNSGNKVTINGSGSHLRSFLHVTDVVKAFELLLEKGSLGQVYNIGCDEGMEYSSKEIAIILIKKIKNTDDYEKWITYIPDRPFHDQRYYISNQKIRDLGWDITIQLDDGLNGLVS